MAWVNFTGIVRICALALVFAGGVVWHDHYYNDPVSMELCLAPKSDAQHASFYEFKLKIDATAPQTFPVPDLNGTISFSRDTTHIAQVAYRTNVSDGILILPLKGHRLCS